MNLKRILATIVVLVIPIFIGIINGKLSTHLTFFFQRELNFHVYPFWFQILIIGFAAAVVALLTVRFVLKRQLIFLIILIFSGVTLLRMHASFYENHNHPNESQMSYLRECEREINYDTFWEYLNEGCHVTLGELIRTLCYKSATWIGVFFLTDLLIRKTRRSKNKKNGTQLIDEI